VLDRKLKVSLVLGGILLVGAAPVWGQDRDDDDHALARRIGQLERKIDGLEKKLDRVLHALEKSGALVHEDNEKPIDEAHVPNAVFGAFKKAYPHAHVLGWVQEGDSYEAKVEDGSRKLEVEYAEDGSLKEIEEQVAIEAVPENVRRAAASKYAHATILHCVKQTKAGHEAAPRYELVLKDGDKGVWLLFEQDGTLAKEHELSKERLAEVAKNASPVDAPKPEKMAPFVKETEIALPGEGSWDYCTVDSDAARLYVAHMTDIDVIDLKKNEKVGQLIGLEGAHGIAVVPEVDRVFATSGRNNKVCVYGPGPHHADTISNVGEGPDAILYVTSAGEVWTMNHKGGTISCVDPKSLQVTKTIDVGGALEFAREDAAKGLVFVNVEDKDLLVAIDAKKHEVIARYPVAPGKAPAGLAYDAKDGLLFIGCDNKTLVVLDAATGKVVTSLASGEHCDGCAFDPETGNVVASCRGWSWAFHVKDAKTVEVLGALDAGKTCTLDPKTHKVYITSGTRGQKDSVKVLVFEQPLRAESSHAERSDRADRPSRSSRIARLKDAVGLSDEQVEKATAIEQQMYAAMEKAREEIQDRAERSQKMTALVNDMRAQVRVLLKNDQLTKFDEWVKKEEEAFQARGQQSRGGRSGGGREDAPQNQRPVNGHPDKTIVLPSGPLGGGFDYLNAHAASRRLYVAHSSKIDVIDMDKDEKTGEVMGVDGAHGTAIAFAAKRGFATAGRKKKLIAFDLDTNLVVKEIDTGEGPDAVIYASSVDECWSINHRGGNVTCVDVKSLEVKATIDVGGTLEFAAEIGDMVFVNVEDQDQVAAIDARKHVVVARYSTAPGTGPAGLASDPKDGLLFVGCHNRKLVALDGASGKVVATFDIGSGCDAVAFDPESRKVYASCGDGTTTVVPVKDAKTFGPSQTIETARGGKCCSVDATTHKLYVGVAPRRGESGEAKVLVFLPAAKTAD
jgi:DNA-binding beta-propeller fold protein YncE